MSKKSALAEKILTLSFATVEEAVGCGNMAISGKRTMSRAEAEKVFAQAGDTLDQQFARMDHNMQALGRAEVQVAERARDLIGRSKDLAAKVGDAMARIDKVVVKDFEVKLSQLERFVAAMTALAELKQSGRLNDVFTALGDRK